jgi:hypothetical protein
MKTVIEMAREAGYCELSATLPPIDNFLKRFAALVRADELEACAQVCEATGQHNIINQCAAAIRVRGQSCKS